MSVSVVMGLGQVEPMLFGKYLSEEPTAAHKDAGKTRAMGSARREETLG